MSRLARQPQPAAVQGSARRRERQCLLVIVALTLMVLIRRPEDGNGRDTSNHPTQQTPSHTQPTRVRKGKGLLKPRRTRTSFDHPRVLGVLAYPTQSAYVLLTERLDPHLIDYSSEFQRRYRREHNRQKTRVTFMDVAKRYRRAIRGSDVGELMVNSGNGTIILLPDDPLVSTMLTVGERAKLLDIQEDSEDYLELQADELNDDSCEVLSAEHSKWMEHHFPSCNSIHEFDRHSALESEQTKIIAHGYWRDVWPYLDQDPLTLVMERKVAMKSLRYEHDYSERNFDRHRRDALAAERLAGSPHITDIYSYCANTGLFEFASEGSLTDTLDRHYAATVAVDKDGTIEDDTLRNGLLDSPSKLMIARDLALALADLHEADAVLDRNSRILSSAIVHADISSDQFLKINGIWKLNDFNRCRFMRRYRNVDDFKPCGFIVENNPGKGRSPEEYMGSIHTEKIDIYSLGNLFYTLYTDMDPWEETSVDSAQENVRQGKRPTIPSEKECVEPSICPLVTIRKCMWMCWEQDADKRPSARELATILEKAIADLA